MEPRLEPETVTGATVPCAACGTAMPPGRTALKLSDLPTVLRASVGGYRFDRLDCARARIRDDYRSLVRLRTTNESGWNAHATTNQERMLTLKTLADWLERQA